MNMLESVQLAIRQQQRAAEMGFDWPNNAEVFDKVREELLELDSAQTAPERQDELGDVLFVLINLASRLDIDVHAAIDGANQKFAQRFVHVEQGLLRNPNASLEQMEAWWQQAKQKENVG